MNPIITTPQDTRDAIGVVHLIGTGLAQLQLASDTEFDMALDYLTVHYGWDRATADKLREALILVRNFE